MVSSQYSPKGLAKILYILLSDKREVSDYGNKHIDKIRDMTTLAMCIDNFQRAYFYKGKNIIPMIITDDFDFLLKEKTFAIKITTMGENYFHQELNFLKRNTIIKNSVKEFGFMKINPSTQLTDSFYPTMEDWYYDLYLQ
jgi:hypothetical protein